MAGEPAPAIGAASGYAFINANDPFASIGMLNPNRSIVVRFSYIRVQTVFVATLDAINAYNNKWPQNGGPKPITGGLGVAVGVFAAKPPLGACGSPNPQQGIIISGHAVVTFDA